MFYFWELLISLIVIAEPVVQCLSKSTKASVSAVSFSLSFSFFLLLFLLLLLLLVYSSSFPSTVSLKVLILWQFFCDFLTYMYYISMMCVFISQVQPGTVPKRPIMCYIFEKQALWGYQIWYWEVCMGHQLGHHLGHIWGMSGRTSGACLADSLGHHLGHVWDNVWDIL